MIEITGVKFITEKEASKRYGRSRRWFQDRRSDHKEPVFIKIEGKGNVFYPLEKTDKWFHDIFKIDE